MIKRIIFVSLVILFLNLIWEFSHHNLYIDLTAIPSNIHLVLASFMDVFLILFFLSVITLKNKNINWLKKPSGKDYLIFVIIAMSFAFIWEIINLYLGRWQYTSSMPKVLGVGLSPLLQLAVTGSIALYINFAIFFHAKSSKRQE
ncbi:MAG: hypothetical protein ACOC1P_01150 [Minisyncoccales bacterium]